MSDGGLLFIPMRLICSVFSFEIAISKTSTVHRRGNCHLVTGEITIQNASLISKTR